MALQAPLGSHKLPVFWQKLHRSKETPSGLRYVGSKYKDGKECPEHLQPESMQLHDRNGSQNATHTAAQRQVWHRVTNLLVMC